MSSPNPVPCRIFISRIRYKERNLSSVWLPITNTKLIKSEKSCAEFSEKVNTIENNIKIN